jgi:hypothetical protein
MKNSFELPGLLISEIQSWNKDNPDSQISISITSRKALEDALRRAKDNQTSQTPYLFLRECRSWRDLV